MAVTQKALRSLLSDAIVELCRREAFYVEELRIEGTICIVSDRTAALIVQITEQVGDKPSVDDRKLINDVQLPVVVTTDKINVAVEAQLTVADQNAHSSSQTFRRRRLRVCRLCGARFVRRGSLQSHVRRRHSSVNSSCQSSYEQSNSVAAAGHVSDNEFHTEQDASVAVLKSEPGVNNEHSHAFGAEINLGLQQMVRTLSMMSSFPVGGKSHFPAFSVPASSSSAPYTAGDDEVQTLRRSADGKFACPYCTKTYGFKHSLKEHIDVHRGRRPHVCRHCGAAFAHLASLCSHIRRRHDDRMPSDFRCTLCGEKLMNLQSLKQHRTWRHKDAPRLSDPLPPNTPGVDQQCETSPAHIERNVDAKKDNLTVGEVCRMPLSISQWSTMSSGSGVNGVEAKQLLSGTGNAASSSRKDVNDILGFDGFDFRGYLPSTADFLAPSTQSDWNVNHVSGQSAVGTVESTMGLASDTPRQGTSTAPKCFVGNDMLPMQPHQQQQIARNMLPYRHSTPFTETVTGYVSTACAGCTAKFHSDSEYRQHIACNPDHVQLSWRQ
jgi:transcription elongation factor Elf1